MQRKGHLQTATTLGNRHVWDDLNKVDVKTFEILSDRRRFGIDSKMDSAKDARERLSLGIRNSRNGDIV